MREFLEKYGLPLLIITTVCAVLISVLSFVSATAGFLQNAVGVLTYPFRSAVTAVATWAEDKQRYYKDYSDLIAENEALRERVAELERDARQAEADRAENALLRELLERYPDTMVFDTVYGTFARLYRVIAAAAAGLAPDDIASALGMKPYAVKKNLTLSRRVPPAALRRALELCRHTDELVKRVSRDKPLTAEVFVLQLTGLLRGMRA